MSDKLDFFISYNHRDERWAVWIAWQLEHAGYSTRIQAWDFKPGGNFVLEMQHAASEAERTIAVLSPNYLASMYAQPEWAAAFAADPTGEKRKLILVRVQQCEVDGILSPLIPIRIENLEPTAAISNLLEGISNVRLKPKSSPNFPGASATKEQPRYPGDLPKIWNVPFPINRFFTGRETLLSELDKKLNSTNAPMTGQPVAVHGLGGIGKTQLVVQYAWLHRSEFDAIFWINADGASTVFSNYADLTTLLNFTHASPQKLEERIGEVTHWLKTNRRWLIIFDTADSRESIDAVRKTLPAGLPGKVILTSRISDWPVDIDSLQVDTMSSNEAIDFLTCRTSQTSYDIGDQDLAAQVAGKLGNLPLALEQAAAYILRHKILLSDYNELIINAFSRISAFPSEGGTGYQKTVATTWLVSMDRLGAISRALLRLIAFFGPEDIPRNIFSADLQSITAAIQLLTTGIWPSENDVVVTPQSEIDDALAELADYSLIRLRPDAFDCHSLLQTVELNCLNPQSRKEWNVLALGIVTAFAAGKEESGGISAQFARKLFSVARNVLNHSARNAIQTESGFLWLWLGQYYQLEGMFADAEEAYKKALDCASSHQNNDHNIAIAKNHLASVLFEEGRLPEAETLLRESVVILDRLEPSELVKFAYIMGNLGECLARLGKLDEGEAFLKRALEIEEMVNGTISPQLAMWVNCLAESAQTAGRFKEAEALLRHALKLASHPDADPGVLIVVQDNLGSILRRVHKLKEAEEHIRKSYEMTERHFGNKHRYFGRALNNLGLILHEMERYEEAEPMFLQSIQMSEEVYGTGHFEVGISLNNLGRLLRETDRAFEAEEIYLRSIKIFENNPNSYRSRIQLATTYANLGHCYTDQGKFDEAEKAFKKALELDQKTYGRDHVEVASDMSNLGLFLMNRGRYFDAEPLLRRSVKILKLKLGKENPLTIGTTAALENVKMIRLLFGLKPKKK